MYHDEVVVMRRINVIVDSKCFCIFLIVYNFCVIVPLWFSQSVVSACMFYAVFS
jgi:hypothetical protein